MRSWIVFSALAMSAGCNLPANHVGTSKVEVIRSSGAPDAYIYEIDGQKYVAIQGCGVVEKSQPQAELEE